MGKVLFMRKGETHTAPGIGLPSGYTELVYIQSSGLQYVDTGFVQASDSIKFVLDLSYASVASGQALFGTQTSTGTPYGLVSYTSSAGVAYFYVANSSKIASVNITANQKVRWELAISGGTLTYTVDGSTKTATYSGTPNKSYSYYLFANNHAGTANQYCSARLYSCQIYDDGACVRWYVPVVTDGGDIGLYDVITRTFYGNAGTGVFTGSEVA